MVNRCRGTEVQMQLQLQRCRGAEWVLMLRFNRRGDCAGGMQRWEWRWYRGAKVVQRCIGTEDEQRSRGAEVQWFRG